MQKRSETVITGITIAPGDGVVVVHHREDRWDSDGDYYSGSGRVAQIRLDAMPEDLRGLLSDFVDAVAPALLAAAAAKEQAAAAEIAVEQLRTDNKAEQAEQARADHEAKQAAARDRMQDAQRVDVAALVARGDALKAARRAGGRNG